VVRKTREAEIYFDETRDAWHASIPVEVGVEETRRGRKSEHIVRGERKSIQIEPPEGNKAASIDLGINVLASVVIDDGTWLLTKVSGLRGLLLLREEDTASTILGGQGKKHW